MLKIRLRRMGTRHKPFYRLVVNDSRRTPRAKAVDEVGYYDPRAEPPKIEEWTESAAARRKYKRKRLRKRVLDRVMVRIARMRGDLPGRLATRRPDVGLWGPQPATSLFTFPL